MGKMVGVLHLHEETWEDQERAEEEVSKNAAVLDAEDWSAQQAQSLSHKGC